MSKSSEFKETIDNWSFMIGIGLCCVITALGLAGLAYIQINGIYDFKPGDNNTPNGIGASIIVGSLVAGIAVGIIGGTISNIYLTVKYKNFYD